MGDGHGGIEKVASSWTLRGWIPPWTRATVTLHGLKSPSTWMYNSTTYRKHAKNLRVSNCVCTLQSHPFTFLQFACFTAARILLSCLLDMIVSPTLNSLSLSDLAMVEEGFEWKVTWGRLEIKVQMVGTESLDFNI